MAVITQAPRGTEDVLPEEAVQWQVIEAVMRSEASLHGFGEVRTPVFEHTELFQRGVGDTTDIVQKEMYTFLDKGGRSVTLRPEGTAGAARAMLEHGVYNNGLPVKFYYFTSCYRYEKAQKGRLREFHQFGAEMYGSADPLADAEVILLGSSIFERFGLKDVRLEINSIGCPECRAKYLEALRAYFEDRKGELCETCLGRLERNPMRILDCKSPVCSSIAEGAPRMLDYLCDGCREHFESVKQALDAVGVAYTVNPSIVRGLDYYTRTVFEFLAPIDGKELAVCAGGRYDGLIEELGGQSMPALGFGLGMERLLLLLKQQSVELPGADPCEIFIASLGQPAKLAAFRLCDTLWKSSVQAACDVNARGLKAQMKYADKIGAKYCLVLGDDELAAGKAELKNMKTGEKKKISLGESFLDDYLTAVTMDEDLSF
ncbi:MAG: histidine--tRNA ligase [Clostridiales bacterium]|nr:MAG: histidine--tRNA ligase [Clostridiales bacterium]